MKNGKYVLLVGIVFIVIINIAFSEVPNLNSSTEDYDDEVSEFKDKYGEKWSIKIDEKSEVPRRILGYGIDISSSLPSFDYTQESALIDSKAFIEKYIGDFIDSNQALFRINQTQLKLSRLDYDKPKNENDEGTFYIFYEQVYNGLPVFNSSFGVVIDNRKLTLIDSNVYPNIDISIESQISKDTAVEIAAAELGVDKNATEDASLVIFQIKDESRYTLAWKLETKMVNNMPAKWLILVDAHTGRILLNFSNLRSETIFGNVTGNIYPEHPSQQNVTVNFGNENVTLHTTVEISSNTTNENGSYVINADGGNYTLKAALQGPFVKVINADQASALHEINLSVPSAHNWNWNESDKSYKGEESNTFYHVNKIHDFFTKDSPFNITSMNYQSQATVEYSSATCNAFSNGTDIFFYGPGGGCESTALSSDVIYHEYVHSVHYHVYGNTFLSPNGAVAEGLADYFAATTNNNSCFAEEVLGSACLRNTSNTLRTPDDLSGEEHADSRIFSGALWDMRTKLGSSLADNLTMRAMKMRPYDFTAYLDSILIADDNNTDLSDGTPHLDDICESFYTNHGITSDYCFGKGVTPHLYTNSSNVDIPDNDGWVFSEISVSDKGKVKKVLIYVGINHTFRGDLRVDLISPDKKVVTLHNRTGSSADNIYTWYDNETVVGGAVKLTSFKDTEASGTWILNATDKANLDTGFIDEFRLRLLIDKLPEINVTSPINNSKQSSTSILLNITLDEDASWCGRGLDDSQNTALNGTGKNWFENLMSLNDSLHNVKFTCNDTGGNTNSTDKIFFTIDTAPPNITFVPPSDVNNSYVSRDHTFINVTVNDTLTDISSCVLEWNGTNHTMTKTGSGNFVGCFLNKTGVEGEYNYKVHANDSLGNSGQMARIVIFDITIPTIINQTPANGDYIKGSDNEPFALNYTEINVGTINLFWRNATLNYTSTTFTGCIAGTNISCANGINLSEITDNSTIQFFFNVSDKANNSIISGQNNITIDRLKPKVSIQSPTATTYPALNITLNFTASDNVEIRQCKYELNGTNTTVTSNVTILVSERNHTLRVFCNDKAENVGTASVSFLADLPPQVNVTFSGGNGTLFSPNGDGIYDEISFIITASEVVDFNTTYILAENGTQMKRFNTVKNVTLLNRSWDGSCSSNTTCIIAPDGVYNLRINITDKAGNVNITNISQIILDITKPQLSFVSPTPNNETLNMSNSVTVNITANENLSSALLELNGNNYTMNGNSTNWFNVSKNLADGNYTFKVYIDDFGGNRNVSETRWVFVNVTRNITSVIKNLDQNLSPQNINLTLLNSTGSPADSNNLLSFENYTLRFNISNILVETADFLVGNLNSSAIINITKNITAESNISKAFNESGSILDNYVWVDLNNLLQGNFTAKVTFPKRYAIYFYLNGTRDAPTITRVNSTCNAAFSNVPCYNTTANASTLYLPSFSGGAGGNDTQAPSLSVSSPTNTTYSSSSISLTYTVSDNVAVDKCWRRLNNGDNVTLANCENTTITAAEGSNNLTVYVNDTSGNINQTNITFTFTPATTTTSGGGSSAAVTAIATAKKNQTVKATEQPEQNKTEAVPTPINQTEIPTAANETIVPANQTGVGITGFVTAFPNNLIIGGVAIAVIFVLLAWKLKSAKKGAKHKEKRHS